VNRITIIVAMLNEAEHVEQFVEDVAAQDFDGAVELIVADGGSTDSSVERLRAAADRKRVSLVVLENPARWVSQGLNACIREATGDLLVRLDCHSRYPSDYLRRCAEVAEDEPDAAAVGGIVVPRGRTSMERAVACAMDGPFGGIGWMRDTDRPMRRESDVITYGAFRPETFRLVGLFDESLLRNQDDELSNRIRLNGGRLVLDSAIKVFYTPRGSLGGVARQYFEYGYWKVAVMRKHGRLISVRSIVPLAFLFSLAVLAPAAVPFSTARRLLGIEVALYAASALIFGAASVRRRREQWRLLPRAVAVFPTFHLSYGIGMARGWIDAARSN
jgi:glycosyltransferase involved in cell wall biosynthesis